MILHSSYQTKCTKTFGELLISYPYFEIHPAPPLQKEGVPLYLGIESSVLAQMSKAMHTAF